jgi:hypothetical protein
MQKIFFAELLDNTTASLKLRLSELNELRRQVEELSAGQDYSAPRSSRSGMPQKPFEPCLPTRGVQPSTEATGWFESNGAG